MHLYWWFYWSNTVFQFHHSVCYRPKIHQVSNVKFFFNLLPAYHSFLLTRHYLSCLILIGTDNIIWFVLLFPDINLNWNNRCHTFLLLFPNVKIDWNISGYIIIYIRHPNWNRDCNHLLIECQRNVCKLKPLFLNCARCTGLALKIITSYFYENSEWE